MRDLTPDSDAARSVGGGKAPAPSKRQDLTPLIPHRAVKRPREMRDLTPDPAEK